MQPFAFHVITSVQKVVGKKMCTQILALVTESMLLVYTGSCRVPWLCFSYAVMETVQEKQRLGISVEN